VSPRIDALRRAFDTPVEGPTYRPLTRVLAASLVAGLIGWGAQGALSGAWGPIDATRAALGGVLALALLWPMPSMLFGRTVVDAAGIRQVGPAGRTVRWEEVQRVRFVRVPLAPRLVVSAGIGRVRVFHSGSPALDDAYARAVRLLTGPIEPAAQGDGR
jgi:hypothetical protein